MKFIVATVTLFLFVGCSVATDKCEDEFQMVGKNKGCEKLLVAFATLDSTLSQCLIKNGVPVSICEKCIVQYNQFKDAYDAIKGDETCVKCYFDQDRLNIIENMFLNVKNLWEKAYCAECSNNGNETFNILEEIDAINTCIKTSATKNIDPCTNCTLVYEKANKDYNALHDKYKDKICFDIQDKMNRTRLRWSRDLKCCKRTPSMKTFAAISSSLLVLVVTFYAGFIVYAIRKRNNPETLTTDFGNTTRRPNRAAITSASNRPLIENEQQPSVSSAMLHQPVSLEDNKKVLKVDISKNVIDDSDDDSIDNEDDLSTVASISRSKLDEMEPVLRSSLSSIDSQDIKINAKIDKKIK